MDPESHTAAVVPLVETVKLMGWDHLCVRPNCGLCSASLTVDEPILLLFGRHDSTSISKPRGPFAFHDNSLPTIINNEVWLCRKLDCGWCAGAYEGSTVHPDCFELATRRCSLPKTIHHLWIMTTWRSPWRHAPHLRLEEEGMITPDFSITDKLAIPQMRALPPEILHLIYKYSRGSLFWRYSVVSELTSGLLDLPDKLRSVPLSDIASWSRGGQLEMASDICQPLIRLTIDSWGIVSVEGLSSDTRFKRWRTDSMAYIVVGRNHTSGIKAHFKSERMRLELPEPPNRLQIWDTPTPPRFLTLCDLHSSYMIGPAALEAPLRFNTIDLGLVLGLTFFFDRGGICGIHPHTARLWCAQSTYQCLPTRPESIDAWIYVPVSRQDYIAAMGICFSMKEKINSRPDIVWGCCSIMKTALSEPWDNAELELIVSNATTARTRSGYAAV
ncbi:hypothetical protein HC256_001452 [Beauveria bassiana]|nr:hypothetical protein HC256_001452 [Beauveria bassiana]